MTRIIVSEKVYLKRFTQELYWYSIEYPIHPHQHVLVFFCGEFGVEVKSHTLSVQHWRAINGCRQQRVPGRRSKPLTGGVLQHTSIAVDVKSSRAQMCSDWWGVDVSEGCVLVNDTNIDEKCCESWEICAAT